MVSVRRWRHLGLAPPSGKNPADIPFPLHCENLAINQKYLSQLRSEQSTVSDISSIRDSAGTQQMPIVEINSQNTVVVKDESGSSNVSGSSLCLSKEQPSHQNLGHPFKRRKQHSRKQKDNQEPCLMRGVYLKNMKWQAAIKVDKKQIHLGTVASQEEAAHLYDRAAFMCKREPNFELPEEEKLELSKLKWEEFLALTRLRINCKKQKRKHSPGLRNKVGDEASLQQGNCDSRQGVSDFSGSGDAEQETAVSRNYMIQNKVCAGNLQL